MFVEEPVEAKQRSRRNLIGVIAAVVVVGALVAYGFSRSDDDSKPDPSTPPTIGVIQAPAQVFTTYDVAIPGSAPATNDLPTVPTGTADVAFPPVSSNVLVP